MTTKEFHPDDSERIERVINQVSRIIGKQGIAQLLLDGDPERGVEPIPEGKQRDSLMEALEQTGDFTDAFLQTIVIGTDAVGDLEQFILTGEMDRIRRQTNERGFDRVKAVERSMNELPGWLAENLLYWAIEEAESLTFGHPNDWDELLGLLQIEAEWFGQDQNRQQRRDVWDEVLKFTRYRVEIRHNDTKYIERSWRQSSTEAHNQALRSAKYECDGDEFDFEGAETSAEELYMPETDPLSDLESFVHRW